MNNKDLGFLTGKVFAHRGYYLEEENIPENSIKAFEKAIEKGYGIELDLHLLKDGNIIVFHDDNTERMTGVNKLLKNCNYDDIKELKLKNTSEHIPLFEEVLNLVNGKVPLLIEYKYDTKVGKLEEKSMKFLLKYKGNFALQSFNPFSVKWFKDNYPEIPRGQLSYDYKNDNMCNIQKYVLKNVLLNVISKPDFISYGIRSMPNKRIEELRKKGIIILGWTIINKQDYEFSKRYCDSIIGENMEQYTINSNFVKI